MNARKIESILAEFSVPGDVVQTHIGPVVETHLVKLGAGIRVKKVVGLEDDIALRMGVDTVRVVPNVPGVPYLGVEVPRADRQIVPYVIPKNRGTLPMSLGVDTLGRPVQIDLARAPHLLVAGATGSGKSVCIHTMVWSLMGQGVRFVLIDPKMLEFRAYEGLSPLLTPVITEPDRAVEVLQTLVSSMEKRYAALAKYGCRDISEFRAKGGNMNYIACVIDEWADLHVTKGKAVELPVVRLAQKARACGIHLILATQRPSVKVLPGIIKANFPARIALKVTNMTDSRVVLDCNGAERLLGLGDMLVSGFGSGIMRVHGAFLDVEQEMNKLRHQTS
jgi:S-DNA-T family DNA segregation ATPase FtsK/SpoIIIE